MRLSKSDITKFIDGINRVGCQHSLEMAKEVAVDLASNRKEQQSIYDVYQIYNELSVNELSAYNVVEAIKSFLGSLSSDKDQEKMISTLYSALL